MTKHNPNIWNTVKKKRARSSRLNWQFLSKLLYMLNLGQTQIVAETWVCLLAVPPPAGRIIRVWYIVDWMGGPRQHLLCSNPLLTKLVVETWNIPLWCKRSQRFQLVGLTSTLSTGSWTEDLERGWTLVCGCGPDWILVQRPSKERPEFILSA